MSQDAEKDMVIADEATMESEAEEKSESAVSSESEAPAADLSGAVTAAESRIRELEAQLSEARAEAEWRQAQLWCGRLLAARSLSEELSELILPPGERAPTEEELSRRVTLLESAIEAAAVRELRKRALSLDPGFAPTDAGVPLRGALIRDMPIARLAELMGSGGNGSDPF